MIRILAFVAIVHLIRTFLRCIFQDRKNSDKIAGNITSVINGTMLIFAPLFMNFMQLILDFNIAYNLVDIVNASIVFKLHHIGVFIIDYLIMNLNTETEKYYSMVVYSLIEISNIFVWFYYHKIQLYSYKLTTNEQKFQLVWFAGFRSLASIIMLYLCYSFRLITELAVFSLVIIGSVFWTYGMYKKCV